MTWPVADPPTADPVAPGPPAAAAVARGRPADRLRGWWVALPPAVQALAVYLFSRWIDFLIISRVARFQAASLWNPPHPGYLDVISLWDGDWYRRIAEHGYPATLPIEAPGTSRRTSGRSAPCTRSRCGR